MYKELIYEYEMILMGKKVGFSTFFFSESGERNERKALFIIGYGIKHYLKWTPEQAVASLSMEALRMLKLESVLKYINFPPEMDTKDNMYILAGKLYPNLIKLDNKEITLKVYKRVLEKDLYKFPKDYLSGDHQGRNRAIICFLYMLEQFTTFGSVKEMYQYFSTSNGTKLLKRYRLNVACVSMFEYPIDFLHEALPVAEKDEFWYRYYKFKMIANDQIRQMRKDGTYRI